MNVPSTHSGSSPSLLAASARGNAAQCETTPFVGFTERVPLSQQVNNAIFSRIVHLKQVNKELEREVLFASAQQIAASQAEECHSNWRDRLLASCLQSRENALTQGRTVEEWDAPLSEASQRQFVQKVDRVLHGLHLGREVADYKKANLQLVLAIRGVLETDVYKRLKYHEAHPAIRLIHELCVKMLVDVPLMSVYGDFVERADFPHFEPTPWTGLPTALQEFRDTLHREGIHKSDRTLLYFLEHRESLFGNVSSEFENLFSYDPGGELENSSGGFFDQLVRRGSTLLRTHHFFTPAFRLGVAIPPEVEGALQSLVNRRYVAIPEDDYQFKTIVYNNYQDFRRGPESASTEQLIALAERYPEALRLITIPFDSSFMGRGLGRGEEDLWGQITEGEHAVSVDEFLNQLRQQFFQEANFGGARQGRHGSGYYFPGGQQRWEPVFNTLLTHLLESYREEYTTLAERIDTCQEGEKEALHVKLWQLQSAMIEEANIILTFVHQRHVADDLIREGLEPKIAMTSVCKELADRGKIRSALMLYISLGGEELTEEHLHAFYSVLFRPISARGRLGLNHRNQSVESLMRHRTPEQLRQSILQLTGMEIVPEETSVVRREVTPQIEQTFAREFERAEKNKVYAVIQCVSGAALALLAAGGALLVTSSTSLLHAVPFAASAHAVFGPAASLVALVALACVGCFLLFQGLAEFFHQERKVEVLGELQAGLRPSSMA